MEAHSTQGQYAPEVLLSKAAELCGSLDNLAYVLEATVEDVCRWITGSAPVPEAVMREALVLVTCVRK